MAAAEARSGKDRPADLAILGGRPAFREPLHVGRPNLGDRRRFLERVERILDTRLLTNNGPFVREFEEEIAARTGVRNCVATSNATVALEILVRALGISGEVIVPSLTFVATAHALRWQGITPVFCDVDPSTHNLDPGRAEAMITPRTSGILAVHLWGRPCDTDALDLVARRHGLALIYDAAHAFGCTHGGRPIGGFGDAEVFSFHATKFIQSFEGGAVTTHDDALAARLRLMGNFGFVGYDDVRCVGTNAKMSEVAAAMGLTTLESLEEIVAHNRRNHILYKRELAKIPGLTVIPYEEAERCNYQYVVLDVDPAPLGIGRDDLAAVLHAENVLARRYFYPGCHRMAPYRSESPDACRFLPVTERLAGRLLCLPTGQEVGQAEILLIARILRLAAASAPAIAHRRDHLGRQRAAEALTR